LHRQPETGVGGALRRPPREHPGDTHQGRVKLPHAASRFSEGVDQVPPSPVLAAFDRSGLACCGRPAGGSARGDLHASLRRRASHNALCRSNTALTLCDSLRHIRRRRCGKPLARVSPESCFAGTSRSSGASSCISSHRPPGARCQVARRRWLPVPRVFQPRRHRSL
jgi:hypothetical protein